MSATFVRVAGTRVLSARIIRQRKIAFSWPNPKPLVTVVATSVVALATGSTIMSRTEGRSRGRLRKAEAGRSPIRTGRPSAVAWDRLRNKPGQLLHDPAKKGPTTEGKGKMGRMK